MKKFLEFLTVIWILILFILGFSLPFEDFITKWWLFTILFTLFTILLILEQKTKKSKCDKLIPSKMNLNYFVDKGVEIVTESAREALFHKRLNSMLEGYRKITDKQDMDKARIEILCLVDDMLFFPDSSISQTATKMEAYKANYGTFGTFMTVQDDNVFEILSRTKYLEAYEKALRNNF